MNYMMQALESDLDFIGALEAFSGNDFDEFDVMEAYIGMVAMEADSDMGALKTNTESVKQFKRKRKLLRGYQKALKAARRQQDWKNAANAAKQCQDIAKQMLVDIDALPQSKSAAILMTVAMSIAALVIACVASIAAGEVARAATHQPGYDAWDEETDELVEVPETYSKKAVAGATVGGAAAGGIFAAISSHKNISAVGKYLSDRKALKKDGVDPGAIKPNDVNPMIAAMKADINKMIKNYGEQATYYTKLAGSPDASKKMKDAKESWLMDESNESMSAMEADLGEIFASIDGAEQAIENDLFVAAMEGANLDAVSEAVAAYKALKEPKKAMKEAEKSGDFATAAAKARECAKVGEDLGDAIRHIPYSTFSAVIINLAIMMLAEFVIAKTGRTMMRHNNKKMLNEMATATSETNAMSSMAKTVDKNLKIGRTVRGLQYSTDGAVLGNAIWQAQRVKKGEAVRNEKNPLLLAMISASKSIVKKYNDLAKDYDNKAHGGSGTSQSATESWLLD